VKGAAVANRTTMWDDRFAEVCRRHPDLIAVYESVEGRLALLLRHTLVPLEPEHFEWLAQTRTVAQRVIADLRAAGFAGGTVVLQWLPLEDVTRILSRWVRQYDGDRVRRGQLLTVLERRVADERFLAARSTRMAFSSLSGRTGIAASLDAPPDRGRPSGTARAGLDEQGIEALSDWYQRMAPCWLGIEPVLRRRLVLQAHVWVAECALSGEAATAAGAARDVEHGGRLARSLERLVPPRHLSTWRPWVELVRLDLQGALARPPARRTQAWARWLFLIPYGVPMPRPARLRLLREGARSCAQPELNTT
jgi:hypothetical protein